MPRPQCVGLANVGNWLGIRERRQCLGLLKHFNTMHMFSRRVPIEGNLKASRKPSARLFLPHCAEIPTGETGTWKKLLVHLSIAVKQAFPSTSKAEYERRECLSFSSRVSVRFLFKPAYFGLSLVIGHT